MGSCGVSDVRQHLRSLYSKHGANVLPSTPAGSYLLVLQMLTPDTGGTARTREPAPLGVRGGCSPTFVGVPHMAPHTHQAKPLVMDRLPAVRVDRCWDAFSADSSDIPPR